MLFLKRSPFGVQMRAASEDFRMARMLGVRANTVIGMSFVISGFLASVVSLLFLAQVGVVSFNMGVPLMLFAFVAAVIGGMGSLMGAVMGGYIVGFTSVLLQTLLPEQLRTFRDAFVFATRHHHPGHAATGIVDAACRKRARMMAARGHLCRRFGAQYFACRSVWRNCAHCDRYGSGKQRGAGPDRTVTEALIRIVYVVGLYIFVGNSGVISFGHTAFMAVGAYATAWQDCCSATKALFMPALPKDFA